MGRKRHQRRQTVKSPSLIAYYEVSSDFTDSIGQKGRFIMYAPFDIDTSNRYGVLFYFHGDYSANTYNIVTPNLVSAGKKHNLIVVGMQTPGVGVAGENIDDECWWVPKAPEYAKYVDSGIVADSAKENIHP